MTEFALHFCLNAMSEPDAIIKQVVEQFWGMYPCLQSLLHTNLLSGLSSPLGCGHPH